MVDRPEDYLGPGYYEFKGGFDQVAEQNALSTKLGQSKLGLNNAQPKPDQKFLSKAPRFEHQKEQKAHVDAAAVPGPGHYGPAPGDSGSYNPWFKRSYNMLFTQ